MKWRRKSIPWCAVYDARLDAECAPNVVAIGKPKKTVKSPTKPSQKQLSLLDADRDDDLDLDARPAPRPALSMDDRS